MTKHRVIVTLWLALTAAAIIWLFVGNLRTEFGPLVALLVVVSMGYGPARLIALRRLAREEVVGPRMVPLRIGSITCGIVMLGPLIAAAAGWIDIVPAGLSFAFGFLFLPSVMAVFSDGYQGLWLDALVFFARITPPEEDWVLKKR